MSPGQQKKVTQCRPSEISGASEPRGASQEQKLQARRENATPATAAAPKPIHEPPREPPPPRPPIKKMEWERIAEDDETKGDEWEEDSYGNPFRLPPADVIRSAYQTKHRTTAASSPRSRTARRRT